MALKIIDKKIVGEIDYLKEKLDGKLPIDRLELLYLVNSWGRHYKFGVNDMQINDIHSMNGIGLHEIEKCEATQSEQALLVRKECYDLSKLDTSKITNMDNLFKYSLFNGDISKWDVSNVTSMKEMFYYSPNFNQDLNSWDVSNVTSMICMFQCALEFNQPIYNWDVSNVTSMSSMFFRAREFNQDLNNWNTSKVISMEAMFYGTKNFNQLLKFDTSNVTNMYRMFYGAESFNQFLDNWDVSKVTNMDFIFEKAESFLDKYNSGKPLPNHTDKIKSWFNLNREKIKAINIKDKYGDEIDGFFNKFTDKIELHNNIHSLNGV